jgi:hypothetical protein
MSALGGRRQPDRLSNRNIRHGAVTTSIRRTSKSSFRSFTPRGPIEHRHFQPLDFQQRSASDALQVAVQPGCRFDAAANLLFALRPQPALGTSHVQRPFLAAFRSAKMSVPAPGSQMFSVFRLDVSSHCAARQKP